MNPMQILKEVENDVKEFGSISTDIRETLKSGVADLVSIRDEMRSLVDAVKAKATAALASLKTVADEVSKDAEGEPSKDNGIGDSVQSLGFDGRGVYSPAPSSAAAVIAETGAPAEHVEPAVQAHADALAAGSPPEVAHADAQAAAAAAGAEPAVAAQIAESVATQPTA